MNFKTPITGLIIAASLSACYVVPLGPDGRPMQQPTTVIVQQPVSGGGSGQQQVLTARLYPANDVAARVGIIAGSVSTSNDGKGVFSIPYNGETLTGEATKTTSGSSHNGIANASSPRGAFVRCNYRMNSPSQGVGECQFSDNAKFQLHLGGN
jgi:hypothetical protein